MILRTTPSFFFLSLCTCFFIDLRSSLSLQSSLRAMSSSIFFSNFHIFFSKVFGLVTETSDADTEILTLFEVSELEEELEDEEEEEDDRVMKMKGCRKSQPYLAISAEAILALLKSCRMNFSIILILCHKVLILCHSSQSPHWGP